MFVCKYVTTTAYRAKEYFTILVLLHLSKSSCLPGLWVCGGEPASVHPSTLQLERPLCNSRPWDGDTPCEHPEGKVVSALFSQGLDDLLSTSLANSNLIHLPRAVGGWIFSSLLPCVFGPCNFALKCIPSLWCCFREWFTGLYIATFLHNTWVQVLEEKTQPAIEILDMLVSSKYFFRTIPEFIMYKAIKEFRSLRLLSVQGTAGEGNQLFQQYRKYL